MICNIDPPSPCALDIFPRHGGRDRTQRRLGDLALEVARSISELDRPFGDAPLFAHQLTVAKGKLERGEIAGTTLP